MSQRPGSRRRRPAPAVAPEPLEPRTLTCATEMLRAAADAGATSADSPSTVVIAAAAAGDEPGLGPGVPVRPSLEWTTGLKRVLYVRVTFADKPLHHPQTIASARRSMATADAFVRANSYGRTSFRTTFTDVIVLPRPESFYATDFHRLRTDALVAAGAIRPSWDARRHELDVIRYDGGPSPQPGAGGFALTNDRGAWLRTDDASAAIHELGHNLGLNHANLWNPADPDAPGGPGVHSEYGNPFSVMSSTGGAALARHFNAYEKHFLGWLPDSSAATVAQSGRYTVHAADSGSLPPAGSVSALKVRKDGSRDYWLSSRGNAFWSSNASLGGLEVNWNAWSKDFDANSRLGSHLLDMTPLASAGGWDYGLPLGRTFSDSPAGVHVTPLRRDAAGAVEVAVEFDGDRAAPNAHDPAAPVISVAGHGSGTHAEDAAFPLPVFTVSAGEALSLTAVSRDADGDDLSYAWDFGAGAAGGAIGPGGLATRVGGPASEQSTAPAAARFDTPGVYRVRVTVSDLRGRTSGSTVLVRVGMAAGPAPRAQNVLTGRVLDALGAPMPGVRVGHGAAWTWTDADGTYALAGLDALPRALVASKPGGWSFAPVAFANPLSPAPLTRGADFRGAPAAYSIRGTVSTLLGYTVKDVLVSNGTHSTLTDGLGRYSLPAGNGQHTLTFAKPGYPIDPADVVVDNGDAFVRSMARVGGLWGSVRGAPPGATTFVRFADHGGAEAIGGAYRFDEMPRGTWTLFATATARDGRLTYLIPSGWSNPLTVGDVEGPYDFAPAPAGTYVVTGRVTSGTEAVAGATVTVVDRAGGGNAVVATAVTDDAGRYLVAALPPGAYSVSARKPGVELSPAGRRFVLNSNLEGVDFRVADPPADLAPTFVRPASAEPAVVTGVSAWLTATATDDRDADRLTYTWDVLSAPAGAAVSFHRNGDNVAQRTLATFDRPGVYQIRATVRDTRGATVTSVATVSVAAVLSTVRLTAAPGPVPPGATRQFDAVGLDQFGRAVEGAAAVSWHAVGGVGSVSADGTFTATLTGRGAVVARVRTPAGQEAAGSSAVDVRSLVAATPVLEGRRARGGRGVWADGMVA